MVNVYAARDLAAYQLAAKEEGIPLEEMFMREIVECFGSLERSNLYSGFSVSVQSKVQRDLCLEWRFNCGVRRTEIAQPLLNCLMYEPLEGIARVAELVPRYHLRLKEFHDNKNVKAVLHFDPINGEVEISDNRIRGETQRLFAVDAFGGKVSSERLIREMVKMYAELRK